MKHRIIATLIAAVLAAGCCTAGTLRQLMERISPGLSQKISVEITPSDTIDRFTLTQHPSGPHIEATDAVSASVALHWYLKYIAGTPLSWDCMTATLPDTLPAVPHPISHSTRMRHRYYLNYCTHSYSMAFWDSDRWDKEIDWMALHGINMPLAVTGSEAVWRTLLRDLGYTDSEILSFIAGPAFQAWWLMNNLEGWGGPATHAHIDRQEHLQQHIVARMREFGMEPVFAGYSGMLPHDAATRLHLKVSDPGKWLGYTRPAFLLPTDSAFADIADAYYRTLENLYGKARYFSADPFHEGGNTDGVDLGAAGSAIIEAMRRHNPEAVWVVQGWQDNPRQEILDTVPHDAMIVLDLQAENVPQWKRTDSFRRHKWLYCMLLNFGGNEGLYGKITPLVSGFRDAATHSPTIAGIGLTMEGIENNPVMYELMCELPWLDTDFDIGNWIDQYARTRYGGVADSTVTQAWRLLAASIYACPADSMQQGARESIFCARPSDHPRDVSSWADSKAYYSPAQVQQAALMLAEAAPRHIDNRHYRHDLIDISRQAIAEQGRIVASRIEEALAARNRAAYENASEAFLKLICIQDSLLDLHQPFRLATWLDAARRSGETPQEKDLAEWNARTQITVWGHRDAADRGGLHDYAHREWSGLLRDFYLPRWQQWFKARLDSWDNPEPPVIDFYSFEEQWTHLKGGYTVPARHTADIAAEVSRLLHRALAL